VDLFFKPLVSDSDERRVAAARGCFPSAGPTGKLCYQPANDMQEYGPDPARAPEDDGPSYSPCP